MKIGVLRKNEYSPKEYAKFIDAVGDSVFLDWKYRDTFINIYDYLQHIGIDLENLYIESYEIEPEVFLHYLEFILNMALCIETDNRIEIFSMAKAAIKNIYVILEKMNYESKQIGDKIIITKRSADVDSILRVLPKNIIEVVLEYNDFRIKDNLEIKKKLLKQMDLYIEENIDIKSFDKDLKNAIGTIVNEMGVNHPIKKEPYKLFTREKMIEWYDKCFLMMLHAIRTVEINKIKKERKSLLICK